MKTWFCCSALFAIIGPLFAQSYSISTVAGTDTVRDGGPATATLLQRPTGVDLDAAGNLYIADAGANRVRRVTPAGIVTTIAGTGRPGSEGDGGPANRADLDGPVAVAVDRKNGVLYIADRNNNLVRRVQLSTGVITTIAGSGSSRAAGDGGNAGQASFDPIALAVDSSGNLYIADYVNDRVRKVTIATNIITTVAGSGGTGYSGDDQPATGATMDGPIGLAIDSSNNIYIADYYNNAVRKVTAADGKIITFAGTGELDLYGDGGPANKAAVPIPTALAIDPSGGQLYILQAGIIRAVNFQTGIITNVGGSLDIGFKGDGGPIGGAVFAVPLDLRFASNGDLYVADTGNYRVRRVVNGVLNTFAGVEIKDNVPASASYLNFPQAIALAANGDLIISDTDNQRVRRVGSNGNIATIAGNGTRGSSGGRIALPQGIAFDPQGTLLFCESGNDRIRSIPSPLNLATWAGGRAGFGGDGGIGSAAQFSAPGDLKFDSAGNAYIADSGNARVRKIDAKTGLISTIGGNGRAGSAGVGGPATQTQMIPISITPDAAGNVYVADMLNHRVLKIDAASGKSVLIAGTGAAGFGGDGAEAVKARLSLPSCARLDAAGNLYICDSGNAAVRKVTPSGLITTIAGNGYSVFDKETGPALGVAVVPTDLAIAANGQIYIADALNNRIRKLTLQTATTMTIASGNNQRGDPGTKAQVSVKVVDSTGVAVGGLTVSFTVSSGAATLSSATATTTGDGTATVTVTFGATTGPVVITANAPGLPPVIFNLAVNQVVTVPLPAISPGGVAGAGLSTPSRRAVSVNGIASVFGQNFAPTGTAARVSGSDLVNGKVPTVFAGACVTVGGVRAPIFAVYPTQINFQIPAAAAGSLAVQVLAGCGTPDELKSNTDTLTLEPAAPEFFYFKNNADGKNPIAAVDAVTGALIGATTLFSQGGTVPAPPGAILALYGTSFGSTDPAIAPGEIPAALASATGPVKLNFGGRDIAQSDILYAGVAPGNPGLYQLNFRVPADMPDGDHAAVLTIGGSASPAGPYITVKK